MEVIKLRFHSSEFTPDTDEVFYVEDGYCPELNGFILAHKEEVSELFERYGLKFRYIPDTVEALRMESVRRYFCPGEDRGGAGGSGAADALVVGGADGGSGEEGAGADIAAGSGAGDGSCEARFGAAGDSNGASALVGGDAVGGSGADAAGMDIDCHSILRMFFDEEVISSLKPSLVFWSGDECRMIPICLDGDFMEQFEAAVVVAQDCEERDYMLTDEDFCPLMEEGIGNSTFGALPKAVPRVRYSMANVEEEYDIQEILDEVQEKIQILRDKGVSDSVIRGLLAPRQKLSRLVITKDFNIILADYQMMEITMNPLSKAVYILYLKHPEGIPFKRLADYQEELQTIYYDISCRENTDGMSQSIASLVDPLGNSINEKCSRIAKAFLSRIDRTLAEKYCIIGGRGEAKRVGLPVEMVVWQ